LRKKSVNPFEAVQTKEETEAAKGFSASSYKKIAGSCGRVFLILIMFLALLFIVCFGVLYFTNVSWPIMRDF